MLIGLYFAIKPYLLGVDTLRAEPSLLYESLNSVLIFMGLGVSFSSLQDSSKTQNKLSKKIWEDPVKGKIMIALMALLILFFLGTGLSAYYFMDSGFLREIAIGVMILGSGMFGILKTAIEMFEHHRRDKRSG